VLTVGPAEVGGWVDASGLTGNIAFGARHADNEEAERNQQAGTPQSLVLHF
jgi:hypothetical protein